jgi:hypothetical protein
MHGTPGGHTAVPHCVEPDSWHCPLTQACPAGQQVEPHSCPALQHLRGRRAARIKGRGSKIWCLDGCRARQSNTADRKSPHAVWPHADFPSIPMAGPGTHAPLTHCWPAAQQEVPHTLDGLQQVPPIKTDPAAQHVPACVRGAWMRASAVAVAVIPRQGRQPGCVWQVCHC